MKALALVSLKMGNVTHKASTDDEPVVVDVSQQEFDRLEAMGAVRKPTAKELKLAQIEDAEIVEETPAKDPAPKGGKSKATSTKADPGNDTQAGGDTNLDL